MQAISNIAFTDATKRLSMPAFLHWEVRMSETIIPLVLFALISTSTPGIATTL